MRNLLLGAALLAWFVLVIACVLARQWAAVVTLFALAWLIEQAVVYACDK